VKLKFRHFAGGCDFNKMNIAVYNPEDNESTRILVAENNGEEICRRAISDEEYALLRDDWSNNGKLSEDDVGITYSALEWIGAFYDGKAQAESPSRQAKSAGLKNLSEVSELTGVSTQTLNNWYNNKPMLFKVVIAGCKAMKTEKIS
jgi:hypothetical protein